MLTTQELLDASDALGLEHAHKRPDFVNGIGTAVIRGAYQGQRAVAVSGGTELLCGALLDLLDLHGAGWPVADTSGAPVPVSPDEVTILFAADGHRREGVDALRTLAASAAHGPRVNIVQVNPDRTHEALEPALTDFGGGGDPAADFGYARWRGLLMGVGAPPDLLGEVLDKVGRPELRAYPQLTAKGQWSLRVEGLQAARHAKGVLTLDVGKDGLIDPATHQVRISPARHKWQQATGLTAPLIVRPGDDLSPAVAALSRFADAWVPARHTLEVDGKHEEHALESRVLRGLVPLAPTDGSRLQLLDPGEPGGDHKDIVNWGSQFPTRWGHGGRNSARYLDALLRDGDVPWALELKAALPGSGLRAYYRHAIGQAVLYRQFIKTATPLKDWFDRYGLDQTKVRAGVVLPELQVKSSTADLAARQAALCAMFGLELFWVPSDYAALHTVPGRQ